MLIEERIADYLEIAASDAPAPGGGSVVALCGALGAAMTEMVCNLTVGKEKYKDEEERMRRILAETTALRRELEAAVDEDAAAYRAFMDAMALPKDTAAEKEARTQAMQEALKGATLTPLGAAKSAAKILPLAKEVLAHGNQNAYSDAVVSALLARTAVIGSLQNVRINLPSVRDEGFVADVRAQMAALEEAAIRLEGEILKDAREQGD